MSQKSLSPSTMGLMLATLGVVYGDIGTSPLYTVKEIFSEATGVALSNSSILGAISCIFWGLMLVVTFKYVFILLRMDNKGEGGILSLTGLLKEQLTQSVGLKKALIFAGFFGACLFYGDSLITPAISITGAVEGVVVVAPSLHTFILPIVVAILVGLFAVQHFGTRLIGSWFGVVIGVWFAILGGVGLYQISLTPGIIAALNPWHAWIFLTQQDSAWQALLSVGAIVLALTGAEALYADMGHFGRKPIQWSWVSLVLPALTLNYLGQGALLLRDASAISNPFYLSFPSILILPMVFLATFATVIASQAVISGVFSVTKQAIGLGLLPRMQIHYTSAANSGQIYMPAVNWALFVGVLLVVFMFKNSSAMASAYGIAVTMTMLITTLLTAVVIRARWHLSLWSWIPVLSVFLCIDVTLVLACLLKFMHGGWFPLVLASLMLFVMMTWKRGRHFLRQAEQGASIPLVEFAKSMDQTHLPIAQHTAVYLALRENEVPPALLDNIRHNQVIHKQNLIVNIHMHDEPLIPFDQRVEVIKLSKHFFRVDLHFGFKNRIVLPSSLVLCHEQGLDIDFTNVTYFVSRNNLWLTKGYGLSWLSERVFNFMYKNATSPTDFYKLPDHQVVELGHRVRI